MSFLNILLKLLPSKPVWAHCDIPCGIYDPAAAQLAAKTVLKMVQKLKEIKAEPGSPEELQARNNFVRMVSVKETHAEICKREILILWTDYFKSEHLEKFPDLHDLVWKTCKLCSDNKRAVDEAKAEDLVEAVDKIAHIFHETSRF
ncbi:superoxide dismutase, Ni [Candidatus Daviesbacteria bacterium]|nr:superoxide dismutase, Ni [Candidatus Daviesbacteria bacterium]